MYGCENWSLTLRGRGERTSKEDEYWLFLGIQILSNETTRFFRNVWSQIHINAASYPSRTGISATRLRLAYVLAVYQLCNKDITENDIGDLARNVTVLHTVCVETLTETSVDWASNMEL